MTTDRRWLAFMVLTLGSFMIVLDTTITNVALPSIRADLGFTATSLAWVVNAYMLFFGGFLLLGGRLGDLYGHRRLFLMGIVLFTVASLLAGLASSQAVLIAARAAQGLGGAIASATGLSLMMTIFTAQADRAKAMGVVGFVSAGGGSVGVLLGGILVSTFGWHSVFLVNIPVGIAVCVLSLRLIDAARGVASGTSLDYGGAITVTASVSISAKLVMRFGIKPPLGTGLALAGLGLALLVRAPIDGNYLVDVFPSMVLLGLGAGIAFNPMLLVAMTDVRPEQSGLASGLVNTSFMLGGALGLAILASVAAATTNASLGSGATTVVALTDGYHAAFAFGAIFALGAAL